MKKTIITAAATILIGGVAFAQGPFNPQGLSWDHNTEPDLAGYHIWESNLSGNYTTFAFSVPAGTNTFNFPPGHADGNFFAVLTAYDQAGNESGYSNEVEYSFDSTAPQPPTNCSVIP